MIKAYQARRETEREILALIPDSVRAAVTAHLIMERGEPLFPETRAKLRPARTDWHERD